MPLLDTLEGKTLPEFLLALEKNFIRDAIDVAQGAGIGCVADLLGISRQLLDQILDGRHKDLRPLLPKGKSRRSSVMKVPHPGHRRRRRKD